jgi:azurin
MSHSSHTESHDGSSIWSIINVGLAICIGGFALFWGSALVLGGIKAAAKKRAPVVAAPAAAAPAAADHAAAAPAAAPAPSGPAQELTLKPDAVNPMAFGTKEFKVKAGQTVKLTFDNNAAVPLPHNVIIGKAGSKDALMAAAMKVATDPQGMAKGYVPDDASVIAHTKLVQPGQKETIEFVPTSPGDYPYLCAFPGHSILMNGTIKAE